MKKPARLSTLSLIIPVLLFFSCTKGNEVRFTNYSTERMDSVVVGNNTLVFTDIARLTVSNYSKIKKGTYAVNCVSESKKRYSATMTISSGGDGKRSIQIDGTGAISVLED